jgi:hypothetical protein
LKASQIVIEFSHAEVKALEKLEEKLDAVIIEGLKINGMLSLVPKLIDTASTIASRITSHTAQA